MSDAQMYAIGSLIYVSLFRATNNSGGCPESCSLALSRLICKVDGVLFPRAPREALERMLERAPAVRSLFLDTDSPSTAYSRAQHAPPRACPASAQSYHSSRLDS